MSISSIVPEPEQEPTIVAVEEPKEVEIKAEGEHPTDPVLAALLAKMKPVAKRKKFLKIMIYSDPGAGKTTFLGTAPNNFIMDVEDGLSSLDNVPHLLAEGVQVLPYNNFEALKRTVETFHNAPPQLANFETFSIDSASELHKRGLAEITERDFQRNPLNNRYVAETDQHMENNEHIRRLISSLRDLPMNLIVTAHARTIEPKGQAARTFPDFSEKLANTLSGIMDIVGYMHLKEVDGETKRVLRVHSNGTIAAKTRIGGLPEEIVDPTWSKLWDAFVSNNQQ